MANDRKHATPRLVDPDKAAAEHCENVAAVLLGGARRDDRKSLALAVVERVAWNDGREPGRGKPAHPAPTRDAGGSQVRELRTGARAGGFHVFAIRERRPAPSAECAHRKADDVRERRQRAS